MENKTLARVVRPRPKAVRHDSIYAKPVQQQRSRRTLDRVLVAAAEVVRRDGTEGLTIAAVATAANVSVGGIYRRFKNKQAIVLAIHDWVVSGLEADVEEALARDTDLRSVVRSFVQVTIACLSADEELSKQVFKAARKYIEQSVRAQRAIQRCYSSLQQALIRVRPHLSSTRGREAIAVAFAVIHGTVMSRIGQFQEEPFALLPWAVLERELTSLALRYLRSVPTS